MHQCTKHSRGFTLLEVLVSLVILLVGLLGIAGMMTKGQRASYEAYQRQQALALAMDIAEKIRANPGGAPYYSADAPLATPAGEGTQLAATVDCEGAQCGPADIAKNDLATWDALLLGATETTGAGAVRVGGIVKARGCVEWDGNVNQPVFRVSVAWQGETDTAVPAASTCGTGLYGATDARRRLVTLDVATCRLNAAVPWVCAI